MSARYFEGVAHAALYAKFRPVTPTALTSRVIDFLKEKCSGDLHAAADIGCGSGQSTRALEPFFKQITGLDISEAQISEAIKNNDSKYISYKVSPAETLPFENESLQLVTAGQACHWFDLAKFYKEVDRVLVPNGVLALYGYNFPRPVYGNKSDELLSVLLTIYQKETKGLWGHERKFVDDAYTDQKFLIPYAERVRDDSIVYEAKGTVMDLQGYITSWSGFQKYKSLHGDEAAQKILDEFVNNMMGVIGEKGITPDELELTLRYPFFLLMGRKPES